MKSSTSRGFTIVELLVVIVVIGILAAITIVAYTGISQKAVSASLQSDLDNASKQLKLFQVENSAYPITINCTIPDSSINKCVKKSNNGTYTYYANNSTDPQSFYLTETIGSTTYGITESSVPLLGIVTSGLVLDLDASVTASYPGTGNTWYDISGSGNNGTLTSGNSFSTENGGYIVFDGATGIVNGSINGSIFSSNFTQTTWFYKTESANVWVGIFNNSSPATNNTYNMTFGNGNVDAPLNSIGNNQIGVASAGIFLDLGIHTNQWLFAAIVKSGSILNIYCYKAGTLLQNADTITWNSGNYNTTNGYQVGRHWSGSGVSPYKGNISSITVYSRALSLSEITQNYNATKARYGL